MWCIKCKKVTDKVIRHVTLVVCASCKVQIQQRAKFCQDFMHQWYGDTCLVCGYRIHAQPIDATKTVEAEIPLQYDYC